MSKSRREYNKYWKTPNEQEFKQLIKTLRKNKKLLSNSKVKTRSRAIMKAKLEMGAKEALLFINRRSTND